MCIVLYCIVLYCIVLYCIVLYCIVLYCIVLCSIVDILYIHHNNLQIFSSGKLIHACMHAYRRKLRKELLLMRKRLRQIHLDAKCDTASASLVGWPVSYIYMRKVSPFEEGSRHSITGISARWASLEWIYAQTDA